MNTHRAVINWAITSFTGWGLYGFNLALHWESQGRIQPVTSLPVAQQNLVMDPLRRQILQPFMSRSAEFQAALKGTVGLRQIVIPLLAPCGIRSEIIGEVSNGVILEGKPTIG